MNEICPQGHTISDQYQGNGGMKPMLGFPLGWMIAAGLFFLLVFTAGMSPLTIRGHIKRVGDDDEAELRIRALLGLINYRWRLPDIRFKGFSMELKKEIFAEDLTDSKQQSTMANIDVHKIMRNFGKFELILKQSSNLFGLARRMLGRVKLTEWQWRTAVGTNDAMWTAMVTGFVWSAKTTAIGLLSQIVRLTADPQLSVEPVYNEPHFSTEGTFTANIRLGYALLAGIVLMSRIRKAEATQKRVHGWRRILMRG
ncbi:DUF2953 domain-containing protein [Paenibacillus sp. sptzw28]|uniref:DUF2953 domain-containing protein n=1 Tax=Paenibacillus sp. sptzw28 TaxID=715179 RepID=UPI001C6EC79D|nr:DUF2953 domain-containing protein [Paenibacillus sp. sptzw28]QYR19954.1 DUF2953 domain-containing protein [Paenibacillus sp. sptzw28]